MARRNRLRTRLDTPDDYTNHFLSHFGFYDRDRKNQQGVIEEYFWVDVKHTGYTE